MLQAKWIVAKLKIELILAFSYPLTNWYCSPTIPIDQGPADFGQVVHLLSIALLCWTE